MNFEQQCRVMATAPMTAPERLTGLMDAVARHSRLATLRTELTEQLAAAKTGSPFGEMIADQFDDTVEAECLAQEKVAAWASALLSNGTLCDCRSFLVNRDQFQASVVQSKTKRARANVGFFDPRDANADAQLIKQARKARRAVSLHNDHLRYGETRPSTCRRKAAAKASSPASSCNNIAWFKYATAVSIISGLSCALASKSDKQIRWNAASSISFFSTRCSSAVKRASKSILKSLRRNVDGLNGRHS